MEIPQSPSKAETPDTISIQPDPTASDWIHRYFHDVWNILTRPTLFFRAMPRGSSVVGPLAFALVGIWLGSVVEFLWQGALGRYLIGGMDDIFRIAGEVAEVDHPGQTELILEARDRLMNWFWSTSAVLVAPLIGVVSLLFNSALVYLGARWLVTPGKSGSPETIDYPTALRVVSFGMAPAILAAIPVVGTPVSRVCILIVTVIGAREVYRISNLRALVIALFPKLLFLGVLLSGFLVMGVLFLKTVSLLF